MELDIFQLIYFILSTTFLMSAYSTEILLKCGSEPIRKISPAFKELRFQWEYEGKIFVSVDFSALTLYNFKAQSLTKLSSGVFTSRGHLSTSLGKHSWLSQLGKELLLASGSQRPEVLLPSCAQSILYNKNNLGKSLQLKGNLIQLSFCRLELNLKSQIIHIRA